MIKNKLSELHIWLGEHEKFVLILLFSFTFLYGITFDEIPKIVLLLLILPLTALEVIRVGKVYVDFREPLIFLGLSTFYLFWGENVVQGQGFALLCMMLYILSKYYVLSHCEKNTKLIIYYVVFFSLILFVLGILEYLPFIKGYMAEGAHIKVMLEERWLSFWKKERWPRTSYDCYFMPVSGLTIYGIYLLMKKRKMGIFLLLVSLISVIITVLSEGRLVLGSVIVTAFICLIFIIIYNRKNKKIRALSGTIIGLGLLCLIIALIIYANNLMGLADKFDASFLAGSGGIFHNIRFSLKKQQMQILLNYPFGKCDVVLIGQYSDVFDVVHDIWLDIARRGGLIPFTLVCAYSIISTVDLIKLWKNNGIDDSIKICITGLFYAVNLLCWLEPIIVSRKSFWGITYMCAGLFKGILLILKNNEKNDSMQNKDVKEIVLDTII